MSAMPRIQDLNMDSGGARIGAVRIDPGQSLLGIPELLRSVIDESSVTAWKQLTARIDYIYANLHYVFQPLDDGTGLSREIKSRVNGGKKLLLKPNLVFPTNTIITRTWFSRRQNHQAVKSAH